MQSEMFAPSERPGGEAIEMELPWPPSANSYKTQRVMLPSIDEMRAAYRGDWRSFWQWMRSKCHVSAFLTDEAKDYHGKVHACVIRANARKNFQRQLRMTVSVYAPDRRRRDQSNLLKMIEDALVQSQVMQDDSQIKEHHVFFMEQIVEHGKVVVKIEELL